MHLDCDSDATCSPEGYIATACAGRWLRVKMIKWHLTDGTLLTMDKETGQLRSIDRAKVPRVQHQHSSTMEHSK